jgi:hypothetical protein
MQLSLGPSSLPVRHRSRLGFIFYITMLSVGTLGDYSKRDRNENDGSCSLSHNLLHVVDNISNRDRCKRPVVLQISKIDTTTYDLKPERMAEIETICPDRP